MGRGWKRSVDNSVVTGVSMRTLVGMSTRGNDIYPKVIQFLFKLQGKEGVYVCIQPSPINAAEGQRFLFEMALQKELDYLIILDSDIVPPEDAIEQLIASNKDIVTAPIWFCNSGRFCLNVSYKDHLFKEGLVYEEKESGIEEIVHSSFGCICISKKVIRAFCEAKEDPVNWSSMLEDIYMPCYSDAIFHAKARKLGFQAYVNWGIKGVIHYKTLELCSDTIKTLRGDA